MDNYKLRNYIDNVFSEAPQTRATIEMKEEFLQNLTDKYNDLISEGKGEEAAFNIAAASIGDVSQLVAELKGLPLQYAEISEQNKQKNQRRVLLTSIAIPLYILCPVPIIVLGNQLGIALMFIMIACATGLLIFNNINKTRKDMEQDTIVEEFQEWRGINSQNSRMYKSITSAVWSLGLIVYFILSFLTGAWHLTWLIFLVLSAVNGIIKAILDLHK